MAGRGTPSVAPKGQYAEFHPSYIWAALAIAIVVGFAIGAYLAFVIGYGFPLGEGFSSLIQTHGHLQLVGWAGLFIMGVSLHFLPRLASVPLPSPHRIDRILWLMALGLFLRALGQPMLPSLQGSPLFVPVLWLVVASGGLEGWGILLYLSLLLGTLGGRGEVGLQPAFRSVRPYFGMMAAGWLLYAGLNMLLLLHMALSSRIVVDPAWNEWALQIFLHLVLLPMAFAHSVRLLPLFLALAAPDWPVRGTAYAYLLSVGLQMVPTAPSLAGLAPETARSLSSLGMLLKSGVILWFVYELDLLTRRRPLGRPARFLETGPERPPTRPGLPDYGEFGRFERLVYAAYTWLILAAFFELLLGGGALLGFPIPIGTDAIRHMYVLGFITLLIFGVSVRMLPGFLKKKRVASTILVDATFWLGNVATIFRVLPLMLPPRLLDALPSAGVMAQTAFAVSGLIGLGAVVCLAANLWRTITSPTETKELSRAL